jgi:hypothetical protein
MLSEAYSTRHGLGGGDLISKVGSSLPSTAGLDREVVYDISEHDGWLKKVMRFL